MSRLFILLITAIFFIYVHNKFTFTESLHCLSGISWMVAMSAFPCLAISFITWFSFDLNFTSNIIIFHLFAAVSSFLASSFSPSSTFVNVTWVITGRHSRNTKVSMNWRTGSRWPTINRLKDVMWSITDQDAFLLLTSWSVDWGASCKVFNLSPYS